MAVVTNQHQALVQERFRGLYTRGISDQAPEGFFSDCLNTKYFTGGVATRDGVTLFLDTSGAKVNRFFRFKKQSETPRFIYLDDLGNLRDSLFVPPIWTDAAITDFSLVNYNNRAYITPHNRVTGLASKSVLVYDGSGVARLAAGNPPTGFVLSLANSATSGNVELGYHFFAIAFITNSGFITAPGPAIYPSINATGNKKVDLTGIPLGGSSIVARIILATKAIPPSLFSSNQLNYELFFVPSANGGLINDNTSTSVSVSFFDNELLESADYLIDNLASIPAGVGIGIYNGRLITWGEAANPFTVRVSQRLLPENVSSVDGLINIDPVNSGDGIRTCFEQRKSLIIATPNKFNITTDNESEPNTWSVEIVDKSMGTECFGVATVLDAKAASTDRIFIATHSGLVSFEGYVKKPELSYNIEDVWFRINKAAFNTIQVVDNPIDHTVFVAVPLDSATKPNFILMGDYTEAFTQYGTLDPALIRWSIWNFFEGGVSLSGIVGDLDDTNKATVFFFSRETGNIYKYQKNSGAVDDTGAGINSYIKTSLKTPLKNWICHFAGIKLRVTGVGNLVITLDGEDASNTQTPNSIALASNPGSEPDRLFNFINEKCAVKLRVSSPGEKFSLTKLSLFAKNLWLRRPS